MHLAAKNLGVKENRRLRVDRIVLDGKKSKTNAVHGNPVADVAIPTARQCVGYSGAAVGGRVSRELRFDDCYIRGRHVRKISMMRRRSQTFPYSSIISLFVAALARSEKDRLPKCSLGQRS